MKRLTYLFAIVIFILSDTLPAQDPALEFLNANKVLTCMYSHGTMFTDNNKGVFLGSYTAGGNKETSVLFSANFNLGAIDSDGSIKVANNFYDSPTENAYIPGPLNIITGEVFDENVNMFNRVWSVNRTAVLTLKEDILDGVIDFPIAKDILEWPAKGNTFFNGVFQSQDGAPFFDYNSDGLYNAMDGDHPIIGDDLIDVIPDQLMFVIYNDQNPNYIYESLGVEIHLSMYAFHCEENEALNQSVFTRHKVIKRKDDAYNLYAGFWLDGDVGCFTDDNVGCLPEHDMIIQYNSDPIDGDPGNTCQAGIIPFTGDVPVFSTKILNKKLFSHVAMGGLFGSNIPNAQLDPFTPEGIYNTLQGKWQDGTPITFGGTGFNPGSTDTTKYVFPGNPSNSDEWSMYSTNLLSIDKRAVSSIQHGDLLKDDFVELDMVHSFNKEEGLDHIENINFSIEQAIEIQSLYDQEFQLGCTQSNLCSGNDCLYPGDVNNDEIVDRLDFMLQGIAYANSQESFEAPRPFISRSWTEFHVEPRSQTSLSGVNFVHSDCDGNGIIDLSDDWSVINQNFGFSTPKYVPVELPTEPFPYSGELFVDVPDEFSIDGSQGFLLGDIVIENMSNFHSISYVLEYDSDVFQLIGDNALISVSGVENNSLGVVKRIDTSKFLVVKGNDAIGITNVDRISDNLLLKPAENVTAEQTTIKLKDILISDYAENFYHLEDVEKMITLNNSSVSTIDSEFGNIRLFPNPTNGKVTVQSDMEVTSYQLYNINGQLCQEEDLISNTIALKQQTGLYFIQFYNRAGLVAREKLIIQ